MIAASLLFVSLLSPAPRPPQLNALDDYNRAILFLDQPEVKTIYGQSIPGSFEIHEKLVMRCAPLFEMVRTGNAKGSISLDGLSQTKTEKLYQGLRDISRIYRMRVYVLLAHGQPAAAQSALTEGLDLAECTKAGDFAGTLCSIAMRSMLFADLEPRLNCFGLIQLGQISDYCSNFLKSPNEMVTALNAERTAGLVAISTLANPKKSDRLNLDAAAFAELEKLPPLDLHNVIEEVKRRYDEQLSASIRALGQNEKDWPMSQVELESSAPLAQRIVASMTELVPGALGAEAKSRTQFRLLRLHCALHQYYWKAKSYPVNLKSFDSSIVSDPLGENFIYSSNGQSYDLSSVGTKEYGNLRLRNRFSASSGGPPPYLE